MNAHGQALAQLDKFNGPNKRMPAMAALTPVECLKRLHVIYRDAHKSEELQRLNYEALRPWEAKDHQVMAWADHPEPWATYQIAYRNWSYYAAEAVVRQCRVLRKRAHAAADQKVTVTPIWLKKEGI